MSKTLKSFLAIKKETLLLDYIIESFLMWVDYLKTILFALPYGQHMKSYHYEEFPVKFNYQDFYS